MNPITNAKNLKKIADKEIEMGTAGTSASWHNMYKDSSWIFVGGLDYELTEGDIITVFSQYGEIVNINLVRDRASGKSKGFAFICYEDQRSTILAVDNLNTIKLVGKTIRVDHVQEYKVPKQTDDLDEETLKLRNEGCAPQPVILNPAKVKVEEVKKEENQGDNHSKKRKKDKTSKKSKKEKKNKKDKTKRDRRRESSSSSSRSRSPVRATSRRHDDRSHRHSYLTSQRDSQERRDRDRYRH